MPLRLRKAKKTKSEILPDRAFCAFIGTNADFQGALGFDGTIRIDGRFRGEIQAQGELIVGETGQIHSDVHVGSIIICGEVRGNVTADRQIDIRVPARVFGDIRAPKVTIQEGVVFQGSCLSGAPITVPNDPDDAEPS